MLVCVRTASVSGCVVSCWVSCTHDDMGCAVSIQERMLTAESKCIVAERKVQWLTRERDSLKKLCETFEEADATMRSGAGSKDEQALAAARAATTRAQQRVVVLEQELQEAKSRVRVC